MKIWVTKSGRPALNICFDGVSNDVGRLLQVPDASVMSRSHLSKKAASSSHPRLFRSHSDPRRQSFIHATALGISINVIGVVFSISTSFNIPA